MISQSESAFRFRRGRVIRWNEDTKTKQEISTSKMYQRGRRALGAVGDKFVLGRRSDALDSVQFAVVLVFD